jgi:hypothetical protein
MKIRPGAHTENTEEAVSDCVVLKELNERVGRVAEYINSAITNRSEPTKLNQK